MRPICRNAENEDTKAFTRHRMEQGASQSKAAHGNVEKMWKEMFFGTQDFLSHLPKRNMSCESSWCCRCLYSRTPVETSKYGQACQILDASNEWSKEWPKKEVNNGYKKLK
jgi:hypothetical protein